MGFTFFYRNLDMLAVHYCYAILFTVYGLMVVIPGSTAMSLNVWHKIAEWKNGRLRATLKMLKTMKFQHSRNRLYSNDYTLNRLWKLRVYIYVGVCACVFVYLGHR